MENENTSGTNSLNDTNDNTSEIDGNYTSDLTIATNNQNDATSIEQEEAWTGYIDQESGQPYYVNENTGFTTWVAPNCAWVWGDHASMEEGVDNQYKYKSTTSYPKENLGPEFLDYDWVCPNYELAKLHRQRQLFEQGRASLCAMNSKRLGKLGVGVQLYFELVLIFGMMLLIAGIISIPAIVAYSSGEGIAASDIDSLGLAAVTPGMFAPPLGATVGQKRIVNVGTTVSKRMDVSKAITTLDLFISIFLMLMHFCLKYHVTTVNNRTDNKETTTSDFAVQITSGLPRDATEEELLDHFSTLYQLAESDNRSRPAFLKNDRSHCSVERDGTVYSIGDCAHVDNDKKYLGKWVAEVAMIQNNGEALINYLTLRAREQKIRQTRGLIMKHSEGTPYSKGPNSKMQKLAEEKLMMLEYDQENALNRITEDSSTVGAFIVFNHEESYLRCVEDYRLQEIQRKCLCCKRCHRDVSHLRFRNGKYVIKLETAPDADDVQHEYLSSQGHTRKHRIISRCIIFFILLSSFIIIWGCMSYKRAIDAELPNLDICAKPGLGQAVFGYNHTFQPFNGVRSKKFDEACQNKVKDAKSYYLKVNDLQQHYDQAPVKSNTSVCSKTVHSCHTATSTTNNSSKPKLCPCASASSKEKCTNIVDNTTFFANTIATCYCVNKLDRALRDTISGVSMFLETDGDLCSNVVYDIFRSKFIQVLASIIVALINIGIGNAIIKLVKKERHSRRSAEEGEIVLLSLIGQFMNSTLVIILIYVKIPGIAESSIPFLLNGEFERLSTGWYVDVATFIQTTLLVSVVSSHLQTFFRHFILLPFRRRSAQKNPEHFIVQADMDKFVTGEPFHIQGRAAAQLLLFSVPVVFSPGMPILLFIGCFGLLFGDFVDKYELARLSPHPQKSDSSTPSIMVSIIPFLVVLRLIFATLVFSNNDIFESNVSQYYVDYVEKSDTLGILRGISSEASVYHFALIIVVLAYLVLQKMLWPFIEGGFHIIEQTIESLSCCPNSCKHTLRTARNKTGKSAFTEYYCERFDKDFKPSIGKGGKKLRVVMKNIGGMNVPFTSKPVKSLSEFEQHLGWRIVNEETFPEHVVDTMIPKPHYKVKAWMSNGTIKGVEHVKGQLKRTWEVRPFHLYTSNLFYHYPNTLLFVRYIQVIAENGSYSYRMEKNPRYEVVNQLREEKLSNEEVGATNNGNHATNSNKYIVPDDIESSSSDSSSSGSDNDTDDDDKKDVPTNKTQKSVITSATVGSSKSPYVTRALSTDYEMSPVKSSSNDNIEKEDTSVSFDGVGKSELI